MAAAGRNIARRRLWHLRQRLALAIIALTRRNHPAQICWTPGQMPRQSAIMPIIYDKEDDMNIFEQAARGGGRDESYQFPQRKLHAPRGNGDSSPLCGVRIGRVTPNINKVNCEDCIRRA